MNSENILDTNFCNEKSNVGAFDIIKEAWNFTKGKRWQILSTIISNVIIFMFFAGLVAFLIGILWAVVIISFPSKSYILVPLQNLSYVLLGGICGLFLSFITALVQNRSIKICDGEESNYKNIYSGMKNIFTIYFSIFFFSALSFFISIVIAFIIEKCFHITVINTTFSTFLFFLSQLVALVEKLLLVFYYFSTLLVVNKKFSGVREFIKSLKLSRRAITKNLFLYVKLIFIFYLFLFIINPGLIYNLFHKIFLMSIESSVFACIGAYILYVIFIYPFILNILPIAYRKEKF